MPRVLLLTIVLLLLLLLVVQFFAQLMLQLVSMIAMYVLGAVLYALRIPERFCPGRFDVWVRACARVSFVCCQRCELSHWPHMTLVFVLPLQLGSHQLLHILVVASACVHYSTVYALFQYRAQHAAGVAV